MLSGRFYLFILYITTLCPFNNNWLFPHLCPLEATIVFTVYMRLTILYTSWKLNHAVISCCDWLALACVSRFHQSLSHVTDFPSFRWMIFHSLWTYQFSYLYHYDHQQTLGFSSFFYLNEYCATIKWCGSFQTFFGIAFL